MQTIAQSQSGAEQVFKSTCRMCHGGCSTLVYVRDGRIVKIAGDPDGPLNRGRLCPMGAASMELVRHPARLTHPLIRAGARGEGRWRRASWDEAYDTLCEEIRRIWDEYGKQAIAIGTGTGRPSHAVDSTLRQHDGNAQLGQFRTGPVSFSPR